MYQYHLQQFFSKGMFSSKWTETVSLLFIWNIWPYKISFLMQKDFGKRYKRSRKPQLFDNDHLYLLMLIFIWDVFNEEIRNSWTLLYQLLHVWLYIRLYAVRVFLKMENGSGCVLILNTVEVFIFNNVLRVYCFLLIRRHCLPAISSQAFYN